MKDLINKPGIIDERGNFVLNGKKYSFTIVESPYLKTFKVDVTINHLHKTIRTDTALNEKEKIKVVDDKNKASKFSSKEEAIELVKEYIDQLRQEYLESEGIVHKVTKEDLL